MGGLAGLAGRAGLNGLDKLDSLAGRAGLGGVGRSWAYVVSPLAANVFGKNRRAVYLLILDIWLELQNASRRH